MTSRQHSDVIDRDFCAAKSDWSRISAYSNYAFDPVLAAPRLARPKLPLSKLLTIGTLGAVSWAWVIGAFAVMV